MRLQKTLPLLQHQHVEKPAVVLFHLLFQISKEKLLCLLQSLPTLGSLYHEGFACSHLGVSSIWFVCFHVNRDTPSFAFTHNSLHHRVRSRIVLPNLSGGHAGKSASRSIRNGNVTTD